MDHLRRSYSTSDLSDDGHTLTQRHRALAEEEEEGEDELGVLLDHFIIPYFYSSR